MREGETGLRRGRGLRVVLSDGSGRRASAPGLAAWLCRVAPRRARGTVTVALVSDRRMRALNRAYRGKNYATDVLSFPSHQSSIDQQSAIGNQQLFLGDIVIARGVAKRQARAAGHSERTELKVLALHGLLHLLGYDHERDNGRMRRVERRLLQQGGVRDGLIARTA